MQGKANTTELTAAVMAFLGYLTLIGWDHRRRMGALRSALVIAHAERIVWEEQLRAIEERATA